MLIELLNDTRSLLADRFLKWASNSPFVPSGFFSFQSRPQIPLSRTMIWRECGMEFKTLTGQCSLWEAPLSWLRLELRCVFLSSCLMLPFHPSLNNDDVFNPATGEKELVPSAFVDTVVVALVVAVVVVDGTGSHKTIFKLPEVSVDVVGPRVSWG
jgi:hypothetical protein